MLMKKQVFDSEKEDWNFSTKFMYVINTYMLVYKNKLNPKGINDNSV